MSRRSNIGSKVTKYLTLLTIGLFTTLSVWAQQDPVQMAEMHIMRKEYQDALDIYKRLYKNDPRNDKYYSGYLDLLIKLEDYKSARKLVDSRGNFPPYVALSYIDMGRIYIAEGKEKKAEQEFDKALEEINGDDLLTQRIAYKFTELNRKDYTLKTYEKARDLLKNAYMYSGPLARLYAENGDIDKAVITLLDGGTGYYNRGDDDIKATLLELLGDDRKKLVQAQKIVIKKINEQPDNTLYSDILTWLYTQKGDWEGALMQVQAMDTRYKEGGERLLTFARYAVKEEEYEYALKAYKEILEKTDNPNFKKEVTNEQLRVRFSLLQNKLNPTPEEIAALSKDFETFLNNNPDYYGKDAVRAYAMLEAQYAGHPQKGVDILEKAIKQPNIRRDILGECKLQLGDYYILTGKIWDASLIYTQVDKAFREDRLGEEARFRNGKLAYYRGDFEWAESQLSVLKASTSELIANDALYLSVLLTENVSADSNLVPLERFAYADLLMFQNKDEEAAELLDSITKVYPQHPLNDDILMQRAKLAMKHKNFKEALMYLAQIHDEHGDDVLGDDALFRMAEINEKYLNQPEKAKAYYEQLVLEYPGSTYVQTARKKLYDLKKENTVVP